MSSFSGSGFTEGYIDEIFTSIQGEGLYCGVRQVFVRFSGCNLRCAYCDTPSSHSNPKVCNIELEPGTLRFAEEPNPVSYDTFLKYMEILNRYRNHSISITGGEPLLQGKFLRKVLPELKKKGHTIFLETNGTQADQLKKLLPYIDIISMDIKLPSVARLGEMWYDHEDFLQQARDTELFVKIVLGNAMNPIDLEKACKLVAKFSPHIPVILQPKTELDGSIYF